MTEYETIDQEIAALEKQKSSCEASIRALHDKKKQLVEMDCISHREAVDKLREIWLDARRSDDARDFIVGIIEDPKLNQWFG